MRVSTRFAREKNEEKKTLAIFAYVTEISTNNFVQGLYGLSSI